MEKVLDFSATDTFAPKFEAQGEKTSEDPLCVSQILIFTLLLTFLQIILKTNKHFFPILRRWIHGLTGSPYIPAIINTHINTQSPILGLAAVALLLFCWSAAGRAAVPAECSRGSLFPTRLTDLALKCRSSAVAPLKP